MTDEQFDEICRGALAYETGRAMESTWSRIRPAKWSWLPTIPEILACGCACAVALLVFGIAINRHRSPTTEPNPVIARAISKTSTYVASAAEIPDTTQWADLSLPVRDEHHPL